MNPNISDGARAFLEAGIRGGGLVTDGPLPGDFAAGWAKHPFTGKLAHYWRVSKTVVPGGIGFHSECSLLTVATHSVPMLGPGNYPHCQRCDTSLLAAMKPRLRKEGA